MFVSIFAKPAPLSPVGRLSQRPPPSLRRWLFGLPVFLFGCVLYIPALPPEETNRPPRIEPNGITPERLVTIQRRSTTTPSSTTFTVTTLSDLDLGDTLYVYWLLDFERTPQASLRCNIAPVTPQTSQKAERTVDLSCQIFHNDPALQSKRIIILDLIVSDRPPIGQFPGASPQLGFEQGALWDRWSWYLEVVD